MSRYKALIITCAVIIMIFMGISISSNDIKVVNIIKQEDKKSDVEIIEGQNYTKFLSDIFLLKDITWTDNNNILFEEKNKYKTITSYNLDCSNRKITMSGSFYYNNNLKNLKGDIKFLKKIVNNQSLIYLENDKDRGLYITKENSTPIKIIDDIVYNGKLLLKVSPNNRKVVFYDKKEKDIKIYNLENKKTIKINYEVNDILLKDFDHSIKFSSDAGYIAISNLDIQNISKSSFTVFGADSGRVYGDKIMGLNPVWANNSLLISFIYVGNNTKLYQDDIGMYKVAGDRIGIFNLRTRKIKYMEPIITKKIITPILWGKEDRMIYFSVGDFSKKENKYNFKNIFCYDTNTERLIVFQEYLKKNVIDGYINLEFVNDKLILTSKSDKNILKIIDTKNRKAQSIDNVQEFITKNDDLDSNIVSIYKYLGDNKYIYVKNNCLYLIDNESKYLLYRSSGNITHIYESPDKTKILIVASVGKKCELTIVNL